MARSNRQAMIVGLGATKFSRESGQSELSLAVDASLAAIEDSGLPIHEIDGLVTFSVDHTSPVELARALGLPELRFSGLSPYGGGGACTTLQLASLAVTNKIAKAVICYRALNGRSGHRYGLGPGTADPYVLASLSWYQVFGQMTAASWFAILRADTCMNMVSPAQTSGLYLWKQDDSPHRIHLQSSTNNLLH